MSHKRKKTSPPSEVLTSFDQRFLVFLSCTRHQTTIKGKDGNIFVVITDDRYTKHILAMQISYMTSTKIVNTSFKKQVILYEISSTILSDNRYKLVSKIFTSISASLRVRKLAITANYLQPTGKVKTSTRRLRCNLSVMSLTINDNGINTCKHLGVHTTAKLIDQQT